MRSFSKKLAFVLAAAMVVTAFAPAAKAEAAKEMAINKSSQILYVNEGINHKGADGVAAGKGNVSVYDFSVKNKPADWKTAYSFAWSSSDEDVVSVAKGGVATAVGVGKATVYCKVTEKATKEVTTLKTKVTVKANAYKVEITNADKWDGATVEVNGVVDLNRAMYDEDDNKTTKRGTLVTDYTKWVAEPDAGVEIDQKTGKFTFTEAAVAGEYKLSCYTYQSSKYTEKTAESDVVVVEFVKDKTFEVVQNSTKKFTVTFSQKVDSLAVADVTVNRMINDYAYAQVVKSATLAEDGMSATIEVFNSFADATNYTVKVKDFKETSFVASVGTPVRMEIVAVDKNPAYILTTNAQAVLKCLFYDAKGVDVTDAANYEASVTYKSETAASTAFTLYANKLTIKKNAASVVVVANYRGKFENGKLVGALEAKQEFIAQDTPAIYPTGVKAIELDGNWDNGNSKTTLQLAEKTQELYLQLNLSNSKDEKFDLGAANATQFNLNNNGANERITVTAITPDVADIVNGVVIPHKAGTAVFYVNYGLKTNNNWNDVPFATVEIQVFEDAKLASIAIATPNFIVSTVDTYTVDDAVKDAEGKPVLNEETGKVVATGETAEYSSNEYLYEEMAGLELWRFYGDLIKKSVGTSKNSNNILGYDQRGNRINLNNTTGNVSIKCLTTNSTAGFSADAIVAWPYISTFYDTKYWADNNDYIGISTDGAALKTYLVNCGIFNKADDGEYFTLDYEVTYNNNGTNLKAYFTVTVAEPTSGQNGVDVKPSSSYVDIERYATNDGNNNTENAKTLAFDVFEVNNGVTVGTLNKLVKFDASKKATSPYQFKVLKDGEDVTNQAYITISETSDYPYNQAGALVDDNKVIIALSGNKSDARLDKAINATGSAIVNYYANGGVGSYTFELYKWESADAVDPTLLVQTGATVVLGDNGTYTIDVNAQKSNTVTLSNVGGVDNYSSVDAEKIVKCFSFKDRAGNSIFDNNGNIKADYKYYVDYSAPANASYVYVKEIVFYEALTNGDYALYTVTVDTVLQK